MNKKNLTNEKINEIERLTEENGYLDMVAKQALADYQKCEIANTELQELNAKYYNEAKDLRRENAELQKQVDELKKREYKLVQRIPIDKDGNFIDYAVYDTDNILSKAEYRDYVYQQAVKDTAKEIFDWLKEHLAPTPNGLRIFTTYIKERYGVEVE